MPPNEVQPSNQPTVGAGPVAPGVGDWVSREEYERLQAQVNQQQQTAATTVVESNVNTTRKQRRWQIILGVLLAAGFYFSVASGAAANLLVVGAIIIFAIVSFYDYFQSRRNKELQGEGAAPAYRGNPYKVLAIVLIVIAVIPAIAFFGLLIMFFTLGGGDMGS